MTNPTEPRIIVEAQRLVERAERQLPRIVADITESPMYGLSRTKLHISIQAAGQVAKDIIKCHENGTSPRDLQRMCVKATLNMAQNMANSTDPIDNMIHQFRLEAYASLAEVEG